MVQKMRQLNIAPPDLTSKETGDLIAFLFTLNYFDSPGNLQAGKRLFLEKKCVVCHQVGRTGGVAGPSLDFLSEYSSPIFVATAMWNHGPTMVTAMQAKGIERPIFKNSELIDLIAYLKSVTTARGEEPLYVLPGLADEGSRLFGEKRCIECHSINGQGGQMGGDLGNRGLQLSLTQFAMAMWNKAPAMMKAMKEREISIPQLQAKEMADIVAYLYSIQYIAGLGNPRMGRELLTDKGCLRCHLLEGKGGKVAGDLAQVKGLDSPATVIAALWNHSSIKGSEIEHQKLTWPQFTPEDMSNLVAFLQTQGKGQ
jgi:mono/diheme cytochrome c family protein